MQALAASKLAEGFYTAPVLVEMAREQGVEIPIAEAVAAILSERVSVDAAVEALMARPFKAEG
jgi:glycerol-3-phosphate dehydrogenase (NAD(P)+)